VDKGEDDPLNENTAAQIIDNHGLIEGYETGDNAIILNSGTIEAQDDAVQFGQNGKLTNSGTIRSFRNLNTDAEQQDGIDLDSGEVINEATGLIEAEANAGIDFDGSDITSYITNFGQIRGTTGILVDKGEVDPLNENTAAQIIANHGLIEGSEGLAIDVGAGNDRLDLYTGSTLKGGADFGTGEDELNIVDLLVGPIAGLNVFDGGVGLDIVGFGDLDIGNLFRARLDDQVLTLALRSGNTGYSLRLTNWEGYRFGDTVYSRDEVLEVAPVPLPAGAFLLAGALGGLALLRRRATIAQKV
jgi:hypothetical protein